MIWWVYWGSYLGMVIVLVTAGLADYYRWGKQATIFIFVMTALSVIGLLGTVSYMLWLD